MSNQDTHKSKPVVSVVIPSKTDSMVVFEMLQECLQTLEDSTKSVASLEIIVVESDTENRNQFIFGKHIKVVGYDCELFNFHHALNLGIQNATGDYVALCNNDLIFYPQCFEEILKVADEHPKIGSFSPVDPDMPKLPKSITAHNQYVLGYEIQKHIKGWCIVARAETFKKIGPLDERFNFYFADNDYAMMLRKHNIQHVSVTNSRVKHLEHGHRPELEKDITTLIEKLSYDISEIPEYVIRERRHWLLSNDKIVAGLLQFHQKWGGYRIIKAKMKLSAAFSKYGFGFLNTFVMRHK